MPKVVYTESKGLVQETGTGFEINTDALALSALPTSPVQPITAPATVTSPGVYTIAGGSASSVTMPLASAVPGGVFVFRAATAYAHWVTGSAEVPGTKVFADATSHGAKLAFSAGVAVGDSFTLISDGKNFTVMAQSGSLAFS